jgi:hypothetical protein
MPFRSMPSESLQWFLIVNTAYLFRFTNYTHIKLHVTSLKRLQDAVDWFLLSCHLLRVCARMGRHSDTGHVLNISFHVNIEQGWTDGRILVNSIIQVEALTFTSKVQSIVHAL